MNRSIFALFVALLIHLLFVLALILLSRISEELAPSKKEQKKLKISLKELPKKHKDSGLTKEKKAPQPEIAPPMPKGSQLEKIVKEPPIKYEPQKQVKEPTLNKPKKVKPEPEPKPKVELLPPRKPFIPLLAKKEDINVSKEIKKAPKKEDPLAWLKEDRSDQEDQKQSTKSLAGNSVSSDVKELYGEEFGKLTPGQQKYILDNQEIMRRITQQVLNRVARVNLDRNLNVNRSNVVEFYLHPNGDMSDFKFLSKSGYYTLDDITKETIEYAYAKYPRPEEKTLIRYNVYYNLARY